MEYKDIGRNIKELRAKRGMTQEQLAEQSGFSVSHIRQVELGSKIPSLSAVFQIAEALDITAQSLLMEEASTYAERIAALTEGCTQWELECMEEVLRALMKGMRKHLLA